MADTAVILVVIGEALKLLNSFLNQKIEKGKISEATKTTLMKEAKDAVDRRDYDRFFMLLRRARRM